jgi:hypothetical protein
MNTASVDCTRRAYPSAADFIPQPGDFCWGPEYEKDGEIFRHLYIKIPGSTSTGYDALKVCKGKDRGIEREWFWDGNEDKPTLRPSISDPDTWHGYLTAGRLVSC